MLGYGSPLSEFHNQSKPPSAFSSLELKEEVLARVRVDPTIDPGFVALVEQCCVNTAYTHIVREAQVIKRWNTDSITLIGDAVFK